MRMMPRDESERGEQRKAARLALDTSAHASLEYQKILQQCASPVSAPAACAHYVMSQRPLARKSHVDHRISIAIP